MCKVVPGKLLSLQSCCAAWDAHTDPEAGSCAVMSLLFPEQPPLLPAEVSLHCVMVKTASEGSWGC